MLCCVGNGKIKLQLIREEKFISKELKDQENWNFNVGEDGVYSISVAARCRNWRQNWSRLFADDDLAIQIDDYLFAEIGGKFREFISAGSWNGNELKNSRKKVIFLLPLKAGWHRMVFWVGARPILEEINIYKAPEKEIIILATDVGTMPSDIIVKNLAVDDSIINAKAHTDSKLELKIDGNTQINQKFQRYKKWYWYGRELMGGSKEFRLGRGWTGGVHSFELKGEGQPQINFISIKIGGNRGKYKVGRIRLWEDITSAKVANLRSCPSNKNSEILSELEGGDEVEIISERVVGDYLEEYQSDIWHEVSFEGKKGFIFSSLVEIEGQEREKIINLIRNKCHEQNIDANIILAIASRESHLKPFVRSSEDRKGIFQLGPGAIKDVKIDDPYDFLQNIDGGVRYYQIIEGQFMGRGDILKWRLIAWHDGPTITRKRRAINKEINYKELSDETKKFLNNVLANYEKKDWLHVIFLPVLIVFLMAGLFYASLKIANKDAQTTAIDTKSQITAAIIDYDFGAYDNRIGGLRYTGRSMAINGEYENINKIILRDLKEGEAFHYTEFLYSGDAGEFKEILDGFYTKAGWIKLNIVDSVFWIEREEGKHNHNTFYIPIDGRFEKIKFLESNGKIKYETVGPFEIHSLSVSSIFRELNDGADCLDDAKEYRFDFTDHLFKEIPQEKTVICPESNPSG